MKEKHRVVPAASAACVVPVGTTWSAVRDTATPRLQSVHEINLSVLQNAVKLFKLIRPENK